MCACLVPLQHKKVNNSRYIGNLWPSNILLGLHRTSYSMASINYNSFASQTGFQVRNLIESKDLHSRFPNRYWMTLSIDSPTLSKWEAVAFLNDNPIMDVWFQMIQRYFQEIASKHGTNLICIFGIDNLQSFHAVVLSQFPVSENNWLGNWPYARKSWVNPATNMRVFGKMVDTYDSNRTAIPYIFHHHKPSVLYVRHRPRVNRNNPPVVNAIDELIQGMALSSIDTSMVTSEHIAPTSIVSSVKSHK